MLPAYGGDASGYVINSNSVTIKGSATDNVKVTNLSVAVDGKTACSVVNAASISCSWNSKKASKGTHTITIVAQDAAKNVGASSINIAK